MIVRSNESNEFRGTWCLGPNLESLPEVNRNESRPGFRIGVDIGGTHTELCIASSPRGPLRSLVHGFRMARFQKVARGGRSLTSP